MKTKTAYRPKVEPAEISAPNAPEEKIQPSESVHIEFTTDKAEPNDAVAGAMQKAVEADKASEELKRQIAHLRASEQAQRDYAERMALMAQQQQAQRPMSREEKLSAWRANNGDPDDIAYLESHPEMIDRHDVTIAAAEAAAQQGYERGTPEHREATRELFHRHLGHQQPQPAASPEPAPAFFRPEPTPSPAAPVDRSAMYAAPVSHQAPSAGTGRSPARTIRLTAEEQEYARVAGISDVEYARQKQRLAQEKASGNYGERR